jgi:hypothetical protein
MISTEEEPEILEEELEEEIEDPVLYSQRAITGFSLFFSVIFGAVLMMSNLKDNPRAKWTIFAFAISYTFVSVFVLSLIGTSSLLTIAINGFGGAILTQYFWNKYIGAETPYIARPIWRALIISLLITIPIALAIIQQGKAGI